MPTRAPASPRRLRRRQGRPRRELRRQEHANGDGCSSTVRSRRRTGRARSAASASTCATAWRWPTPGSSATPAAFRRPKAAGLRRRHIDRASSATTATRPRGDGCSADCKVDRGELRCPTPGALVRSRRWSAATASSPAPSSATTATRQRRRLLGDLRSSSTAGSARCPGRLQRGRCGDGLVAGAEACDDGNIATATAAARRAAAIRRPRRADSRARLRPAPSADARQLLHEDHLRRRPVAARAPSSATTATTQRRRLLARLPARAELPERRCIAVCGDGCSSTSTSTTTAPGEECDDGNTRTATAAPHVQDRARLHCSAHVEADPTFSTCPACPRFQVRSVRERPSGFREVPMQPGDRRPRAGHARGGRAGLSLQRHRAQPGDGYRSEPRLRRTCRTAGP